MGAVMDAPNDTAEREAEDALGIDAGASEDQARAEELEAAAAAGRYEEAAGITSEQEAGEASGEQPSPKPKRGRKRTPPVGAQGDFEGAWKTVIGGERPSESKIKVVGGALQPVGMTADKIKKGGTYQVLVTLQQTGYATDDKLDSATHEVSSTTEVKKLKIIGARFLDEAERAAINEMEWELGS